MKEESLRKLARSHYWQTVFCRAKEIGSIRLFENDIDFSYVQIIFLHWLEVYSGLYLDLSVGEENMSREVIENDIRVDAYLLWKRKEREKSKQKDKVKDRAVGRNDLGLPSVMFKVPPHKK